MNNNLILINNKLINKRSKEAQNYKLLQPELDNYLESVLIGMLLSDACLYKKGKYPFIKFEQSKDQYGLIHNLFGLFNNYTFMNNIGIRFKDNKIKSFYFKTFSHPSFIKYWDLFYKDNVRHLEPNIIIDYINEISFSYWIMGDGSLNKRDKILVLHTENLTYEVNKELSDLINTKFNLNSYLTLSNKNDTTYYMINIPHKNKDIILNLTNKHILPDFKYKINYY